MWRLDSPFDASVAHGSGSLILIFLRSASLFVCICLCASVLYRGHVHACACRGYTLLMKPIQQTEAEGRLQYFLLKGTYSYVCVCVCVWVCVCVCMRVCAESTHFL